MVVNNDLQLSNKGVCYQHKKSQIVKRVSLTKLVTEKILQSSKSLCQWRLHIWKELFILLIWLPRRDIRENVKWKNEKMEKIKIGYDQILRPREAPPLKFASNRQRRSTLV